MDEQQRNLIIAVALSIAILLGFQYFSRSQPVQPTRSRRAEQSAPPPSAPSAQRRAPAPGVPGAAAGTAEPEVAPREEVLAETPRVKIGRRGSMARSISSARGSTI